MNRIKSITAKGALAFALLAGSLPLSQAAYAEEQTVTGTQPSWSVKAATSFFDVPSTHWAAKDIAKMTMLDIISGYNGLFDPNKDVSHQHVLVMAVKMMGLAQEAQEVNVDSVALTFNVDSIYKGYVYTAIKHGLINPTEIQDATGTWGKDNASREWVAQIVVRVADKDADAQQKMQAPSAFKDGDVVASSYRGYVNAAFDLGFVSGRPDGTFGPQTAVTRASAAIMLSKAGDLLIPRPGYPVTGTVISNDGVSLKLMTEAGTESTFALSQQTLVYNGSTALATGILQAGNLIKVIAANSSAYFIDVINLQGPVVTSGEGMVAAFQKDSRKVTITASATTREYEVTEAAWEPVKELVVGDKMTFQTYGDKIVSAKLIPVVKGELIAIELKGNNKFITIKKADAKAATYFFTNAAVVVTSPIKTNAQLADLFIGDHLAIELNEAETPTKIDVSISAVETKYMATVQIFAAKTKSLMLTLNDGTVKAYVLDDRTLYSDGINADAAFNASMYALLNEGRRIDITISGERVLKIKLSGTYSGKVISYDRTTGELHLLLPDQTTLPFVIRTTADIVKKDSSKGALTDIAVGGNVQLTTSYQGNEVYGVKLLP